MGYGFNQFPPLNPQKGYKWYDQNSHIVICPLRTHYDETERLIKIQQLEQLGGKILGELDMPLDFDLQFIAYALPKGLRLSDDHEDDDGMGSNEYHRMYSFVDEKGRDRLRVTGGLMMPHTNIWTKYHAHSRIKHVSKGKGKKKTYDSELWAIVQDLEKFDKDIDDHDHEEAIIWEAKNDKGSFLNDADEPAKKWLDENFPDWKNPTAYWS